MTFKKKLLITLAAATFSGNFATLPLDVCEAASVPITIIAPHTASDTDISVCADFLEWHYKVEDGKIYRRLYNASTASWVGDWVYVGEYNPNA